MMEICKKVLFILGYINFRAEQTTFFKLKWTNKIIFDRIKLFIGEIYNLWYKFFITRALHHFAIIIQKYSCKQVGMSFYSSSNCI